MRKFLCSVLHLVLGACCCAGASYASSPAKDAPRAAVFQLSGNPNHAFLQNLPARTPEALRDDETVAGRDVDVMEVVYRISYVGAVVLTADRVVRSVDSVLDRMQVRCDDGSSLRFVMEPKSRGFDVMLMLSRPLEF